MNICSFRTAYSVLAIGAALGLFLWAEPCFAQWRGVVGRDRTHTVQYGEDLYSIAQKYGLAIEHLAFANKRDPNNINVSPGTSLVIPGRRVLPKNPPANGVVVNLPERGCFLFRNGQFEKFYPVAIGQPGRFQTPIGSFVIESRSVDPIWMPPEWAGMEVDVVPAGPGNPLGDRWIGLSAPGIGMHSTNSPMSIGQAVSHGCMRMYPNSVRELFDKVQVGWPVRIEYETAKIGRDFGSDTCYFVTFPDVYGLASLKSSAGKTLDGAGLSVSDADLSYLASGDGVAKELYISSVNIAVGQDRISSWPIEPSMVDGNIWGSPKVAAAAGLDVAWDNENQVVIVSHGRTIQYYPISSGYEIDTSALPAGYEAEIAGQARKIDGKTIIPMRPLLQGFSLKNEWDSESRTLIVSKVGKNAPKKTQPAQPKPEAKPEVNPGQAPQAAPAAETQAPPALPDSEQEAQPAPAESENRGAESVPSSPERPQGETVEVGGSRVQLLDKYAEVQDGSVTTYAPKHSKNSKKDSLKDGAENDPSDDDLRPVPQIVKQIEE
ncbi:L,D-transpeptidase family protein [bacterium]|nr:L,D-transpeptidase family protein [bacterium]